jgi:uncharacterized protein (DUF362 family)
MTIEDEKQTPQASEGAPRDPERRRVLARVASAAMVAGAAGLGAVAFYDGKRPVRERKEEERTIHDHRVNPTASTPQMVIARGADPSRNVAAALERLGGLGPFIAPEDIVVIKPNVGWDRVAAQAANTNPEVVAALVRACKAAGAETIIVTDNPVNDADRCFVRSGIMDAAREAGARVELPSEDRFHMVSIPGELGRWPVFEPFIRATKVINVPIIKHHSLTRATLGMKNWYGILGGRRNQLHQRIDHSVAELAHLMRPTLTVMDGTRILMRNGPTGGSLADVKQGNVVAVSLDPVAVDAWASTMLDLDPAGLEWLRLGQQKELGVIDYRSVDPVELTTG